MTGSGTSRTPSPTGCSSHTGTAGRRPLHRLTVPVRRGAIPTHRPAGQMRILRRDTWVPPYRVRRSCRTGRRDAVPYNGSSHPSAGGDAHTSPRRTNAHFAAGHMGPALQGPPVMQDGTSGRRPLQRLTAPVRRGRCPHRPAGSTKRQAQAPASLSKKSGWTFSASWQAKSQNKNYILFCDFGRCGG